MRDTFGRPIAYQDVPAEALPMTIEFIRVDTGEVVQTLTVTGPAAIEVKPWAVITGSPIRVRTTTANGGVSVQEPPNGGVLN